MRGGIVAVGIGLVFLGMAPWILVLVGLWASPALGLDVSAWGAITLALCCLAPAFLVVGFLIFLAGLVAASPAELAAQRVPLVVYNPGTWFQPRPPQGPPPPPPRR